MSIDIQMYTRMCIYIYIHIYTYTIYNIIRARSLAIVKLLATSLSLALIS